MDKIDMDDTLSSIIMNTLDLDTGEAAEIIELLKSVGVKKLSHIKYVQESDLSEHLNKIQARMLIQSFQSLAVVNDSNVNSVLQSAMTYTVIAEEPLLIQPTTSTVESSTVESHKDGVDVSWHLLPRDVLQKLEKDEILRPSEFRSMVRIIVDDIFKINANPPKKLVIKVAEQCIKKFPVLKDRFDSITLGSGHDNLAYRLYTRVENTRRKPSVAEKNVDSSPVKRRKVQIDSYGCVAWSTKLPEEVTIDSLIAKKEILKKLNLNSENEMEEAVKLLEETYFLQRSAINSNSKIIELLIDWPSLFTKRGIEAHFKLLTDIDLYKMLECTITSKGRKLITYFRSCSQNNVKVFMAETDLEINQPNELLLVILGLAKFFEESSSKVFFTDEVFNPHEIRSTLPKHPCLVGKGTSMLTSNEFMLIMDGVVVNSELKDPTVALASWFAAHYVFNVMYPNEFSCTLEFFQRCFVGINPECGSKTERKKGKKLYPGVHPKILKLLKKLNEFQCWIKDCRIN